MASSVHTRYVVLRGKIKTDNLSEPARLANEERTFFSFFSPRTFFPPFYLQVKWCAEPRTSTWLWYKTWWRDRCAKSRYCANCTCSSSNRPRNTRTRIPASTSGTGHCCRSRVRSCCRRSVTSASIWSRTCENAPAIVWPKKGNTLVSPKKCVHQSVLFLFFPPPHIPTEVIRFRNETVIFFPRGSRLGTEERMCVTFR